MGEFFSEALYLAMANEAEQQNFHGMAKWLRHEAADEHQHGQKLVDYIISRGNAVTIPPMKNVPQHWDSLEAMFRFLQGLRPNSNRVTFRSEENELRVTEAYNRHMQLALDEKDYATATFLQWYVTEQVEENKKAREIMFRFSLIQKAPYLIMMVCEMRQLRRMHNMRRQIDNWFNQLVD